MAKRRQRLTTAMFAAAIWMAGIGAVQGCHAILGLDDPIVDPADAARPEAAANPGNDAVVVLGPRTDGGDGDARDATIELLADAGADAEPEAVVVHNENWDNPSLWNKMNLRDINTGTTSFTGAVFDGRYIYFAPSNNTNDAVYAVRYDTKGPFTNTPSWHFFDTASLHPDARGFEGAFFDGRYVYFVPFAIPGAHTGRLVRYDTMSGRTFDDPLSWNHFDTTSINPYAKGFVGGAFDRQKYAYMAPGPGAFADGGRVEAVAMKYDTTTPFDGGGSWQTFDTQTIDPSLEGGGPRGFFGTVATAEHVYFVPYGYGGPTRGRVVRYDQGKPFSATTSWELFDTSQIDPRAVGFQGGGFDGRHLYLAPLVEPGGFNGVVTRFDTSQPFGDAGSWNTFDLQTLDGGVVASQAGSIPERRGYIGTGFDGRFMYFVGDQSSVGYHGWIARFDTQKPSLDDPSAWSFYDATRVHVFAKGFCGAVFDGTHMYFVPGFIGNPPTDNNAIVVRFHAAYPLSGTPRPPKFMPGGSFL